MVATAKRPEPLNIVADGVPVRVTSPDRVMFPELGLTKLDLVSYALAVGEGLLAALRGRPTTLERWPQGLGPDGSGESFYQKRAPTKLPEFVDTTSITFPSGRNAVTVAPRNLATIIWLINLGTLRFHAWPVTAPQTDLVDQLRLDLDPQPGTDFTDAAEAAVQLRKVLDEAGLESFCKTSGGRGLHVYAPIEPVDFVDARHAAIAIGRELARRMPEQVTVNWWKEERGQRIFVDFNQMARDRLMASAYSIRPMPYAQVSAPLSWDEVTQVTPEQFTVASMPERFGEQGDLWAQLYRTPAASIATALEWYKRDAARGEGEMPYPPEYPKMPGEPPRVQPSRKAKS